MRKSDKNQNINTANQLIQHRYLKSKGLINENNQRPLSDADSAPYDKNIPMRNLTSEEIKNIERDIRRLNGQFGEGIDPTQDFAIKYNTPLGVMWTHGNVNNLYMVKVPKNAYVVGTIGNMNYTDAYKDNPNT